MKGLFNKKNIILLLINFITILGINYLMTSYTDVTLVYRFVSSTLLSIVLWVILSRTYDIVTKSKQRELLIEIIKSDEESGLYDS